MEKHSLEEFSNDELAQKVLFLEKQCVQLHEELAYRETAQFEWSGNLGTWQWNVKDKAVVFNSKKVEALGYDLQDIPSTIGFEFFTEKIHADDYEMVMQNMRNHLYGLSEAYECEYRIQAKTGEWKWFYDRGIITKRDGDGKPLELLGIVFDISAQKQIQLELEAKNEQLLQLNDAKTLMLSIISHDLRGPLGALDSLFLEITNKATLAEKTALLEEIASSVHAMYSLVTNLLGWAVFQKGELVMQKQEMSLYDVSQRVISQLKIVSEKKHIHIENNIRKDCKAFFDEKMIDAVIRNLVSNAIKYTPQQGKIILFDTVIDSKVFITIQDTGVGISSDIIATLFSLSSSKSSRGTDGEKGTGLGLVLTKDFIEKNGGEVSVTSELGKGSSFIFSLPQYV